MSEIAATFVRPGGIELEIVDVDSDRKLAERYGHEVPVLLINGRKAFKYRVDAAELHARLRGHRRRATMRKWRQRLWS